MHVFKESVDFLNLDETTIEFIDLNIKKGFGGGLTH